ncbi:MAG: hypothetical protein O3A80_05510 [bacterium]|nr:hypothetical protein [bacterium]MDA1293112.1 hypothetical protein [bacterium]
MGETKSIGHALSLVGDSTGDLMASPVKSLVETLTGNPTIGPITQSTRSLLTNMALLPGRVFWHGSMGLLKGSAKLAWAGIKNLPIFPAWKAERDAVKANAEAKLATLSEGVSSAEKKNV